MHKYLMSEQGCVFTAFAGIQYGYLIDQNLDFDKKEKDYIFNCEVDGICA